MGEMSDFLGYDGLPDDSPEPGITCRRCGATGLHWVEVPAPVPTRHFARQATTPNSTPPRQWRLADDRGRLHTCHP